MNILEFRRKEVTNDSRLPIIDESGIAVGGPKEIEKYLHDQLKGDDLLPEARELISEFLRNEEKSED